MKHLKQSKHCALLTGLQSKLFLLLCESELLSTDFHIAVAVEATISPERQFLQIQHGNVLPKNIARPTR